MGGKASFLAVVHFIEHVPVSLDGLDRPVDRTFAEI
jgi:hypothetical protein